MDSAYKAEKDKEACIERERKAKEAEKRFNAESIETDKKIGLIKANAKL